MTEESKKWLEESRSSFTKDNFDDFLMWCFRIGASDIFISSDEPLAIMNNNEVVIVGHRHIPTHEIENILKEIDQAASYAIIQSGKPRDFQYVVQQEQDPDSAARFRGSATGEKSGVELVLRTIPTVPPTCQMLGKGHC